MSEKFGPELHPGFIIEGERGEEFSTITFTFLNGQPVDFREIRKAMCEMRPAEEPPSE